MSTNEPQASAETMREIVERWSPVPSGEAMKEAGESFVATASQCQKQTSDFVSSRLEKDRQAIASIMSCRSPAEAIQIQSAWLQETANDYTTAAKRMFDLYSGFLKSAGAQKA
ncbi:MAG: phasin family protein [Beijerinckiaceae bacterium]|nr:phasin family protein [Beijerinckiaceae bacterium]